ncbi:restriction endonuclease subunit S [uncultured Brevundimonas sp.]|uniref:restriction endonuclease subunit S n=1 Tax=uncultured Brevundimonas sp. TaxID=213418 RepID=UPI0026024797|nr:restriction endonuclease subunit S [uncultured Brevundimonas sp.]
MSAPAYESYKDSGVATIGHMPTSWMIAQLKRIATLVYGDALASELRIPGDVKVFGSNGPVGQHNVANTSEPVIFVGRKGSCGALTWSDDAGFAIDTVYYIDENSSQVNLRWLYWVLHTLGLSQTSQDTGVPGLSREVAHSSPVPLPSSAEQTAIAAFLDRETGKIDALIEAQTRLIELLKEKRQAVISHAVTKGLNLDAPMKDSGIEWVGHVPAHWDVVAVKRMIDLATSGPRGWSDMQSESGSLFFQSQCIGRAMEAVFDNATLITPPDDADAERARLRHDDVVVCITGGRTGAVAHIRELPEASYINQHVCLLRPRGLELSGRFLAYAMFSYAGQEQLSLSMYGLKQGLGLDQVRSHKFTVPPKKEQEAIVSFLDLRFAEFESLICHSEEAITLLTERRAALISAAVTGKIDVRGLVNIESEAA